MQELIDGQELITAIAMNKSKNREAAQRAFTLFCSYYEGKAMQMAIELCNKWGKSEGCATDIVQCAFQKVWLYPTFDKSKSIITNVDRAILNWLYWILVHELSSFSKKGNCSHPEPEDLPLITSTTDFLIEARKDTPSLTETQLEAVKSKLDILISGLNEKEKTIYLTYKLYQSIGQTMPRNVLKKLRTEFNMTQSGIRQCHYRITQKIEG